jgi:hypothetical protein
VGVGAPGEATGFVTEEEAVRLAKLPAEQRVTVPRLLVESALSAARRQRVA